MEEISDDNGERRPRFLYSRATDKSSSWVYSGVCTARNPAPIPAFAGVPGDIGVTAHDFSRGIAGDNNVIETA